MRTINEKISNQPVKGTCDWHPEEYAIRGYIFEKWRSVCKKFGYEEYLTPIVENVEIYKAKSGEDVGGKELMTITDQGGRELVLRPEMTPSVTRMISQKYMELNKPIRYFSIANFFRKEKPQRGRNREFWQLNFDIFGTNSLKADIEIIQIALEIMLSFNPPKKSFVLKINNRKLIDDFLVKIIKIKEEDVINIIRLMDKWSKLDKDEIIEKLKEFKLDEKQSNDLMSFMENQNKNSLISKFPKLYESEGFEEIKKTISFLENMGYKKYISFEPNIIRGFDYYNGMVFEVFDNNKDNSRSLFGGGRYNGLSSIFGINNIPSTGCAPGDETTRLFLESWGLLEKIKKNAKAKTYYFPLLSDSLYLNVNRISKELRKKGKRIVTGLDRQSINKALEYANKKKIEYLVIYGEDEAKRNEYLIKDMRTGKQESFKIKFSQADNRLGSSNQFLSL